MYTLWYIGINSYQYLVTMSLDHVDRIIRDHNGDWSDLHFAIFFQYWSTFWLKCPVKSFDRTIKDPLEPIGSVFEPAFLKFPILINSLCEQSHSILLHTTK